MNSLEIREAKIKLIKMINEITFPMEVKRMMLREVMSELESATECEINSLMIERKSSEESIKEEERYHGNQ